MGYIADIFAAVVFHFDHGHLLIIFLRSQFSTSFSARSNRAVESMPLSFSIYSAPAPVLINLYKASESSSDIL